MGHREVGARWVGEVIGPEVQLEGLQRGGQAQVDLGPEGHGQV